MPLMKRTVRDDRGAWSLAKSARAGATDTAMPGDCSSARGLLYPPRMLPVRSTTAAESVSLPSAVAATVSTARTSSAVSVWAAPPARSDGVFWERRTGVVATMRAAVARYRLSRTREFYSNHRPLLFERQRCLREDGN